MPEPRYSTKEFAVDRNIDVFRKSSDETVNLGERGASLEKECITDAVEGEKPLKRPADPEVFLHDVRWQAKTGRGLSEVGFMLRCRELGEGVQSGGDQDDLDDGFSCSKSGCIHAGA